MTNTSYRSSSHPYQHKWTRIAQLDRPTPVDLLRRHSSACLVVDYRQHHSVALLPHIVIRSCPRAARATFPLSSLPLRSPLATGDRIHQYIVRLHQRIRTVRLRFRQPCFLEARVSSENPILQTQTSDTRCRSRNAHQSRSRPTSSRWSAWAATRLCAIRIRLPRPSSNCWDSRLSPRQDRHRHRHLPSKLNSRHKELTLRLDHSRRVVSCRRISFPNPKFASSA